MGPRSILCVVVCIGVAFLSSCSIPSLTGNDLSATPVAASPTATETAAPVTPTGTPPSGSTPAVPTPSATQPAATPASQAVTTPEAIPTYPAPPTGIPSILPAAQPLGGSVVLAWNNLGMHCYQQDYSMFLILPPYNVFWAQVFGRGEEPHVRAQGITVQYAVPQVTDPVPHTNFWDFAAAYGWQLQPGIGLTGKGTSGSMDAARDHWIAEGVPVVDRNDDGTWDPYPFFVVTVQDNSGQPIAQTVNVAPTSTEMSCYLCHVADTIQGSMANILEAHDSKMGTGLLDRAQAGQPVLCSSCHADPAMGVTTNQGSHASLSSVIHTSHADRMTGDQLPDNECQACHPGPQTQCLRDAMASAGITCVDCHGGMADVGDPDRTPWVNLPACESCHTAALQPATTRRIDNPNQHLTPDEASLYRNRQAHGEGIVYCAACHGSPHAIYPTQTERDNEQSIRLQGHSGPIDDCSVCHTERPEEEFFHFGGEGKD